MSFRQLKHPDHPHELMFNNELIPYTCNGCFEPGSKTGYECKPCNFHLHEECAQPALLNRTVFHACSPRSGFKFHKKPESPGRYCVLCARAVTGYNYRCKDLYLHPSCAKLPIRKKEDEVVLELLEKTSKKCYLCGNQKCGSWSYVSGEVSLHVGCVKEKLIEKLNELEGGDGAKGKAKADEMKASVYDRMPGMKVTREVPKLRTVVDHKGKGISDNLGKYFVKAVKMILTIVVGVLIGDPTTIVITLLTSILGGTVF